MYSSAMINYQTLVINVKSNLRRRQKVASHLEQKNISFIFVPAVEPFTTISVANDYLTDTAKAVWLSHLKCLKASVSNSKPTLILEDDVLLRIDATSIKTLSDAITKFEIDFIQIGYLKINLADRVSILLRNFYGFFTRHALAANVFGLFGFKEVSRAKDQVWRNSLPKDFIVNDVRYGAHCYLVSPSFAGKMITLNDPPFLAADDFYVALSRMKSFKMIRLKKSQCSQDGSKSSFNKRFLLG